MKKARLSVMVLTVGLLLAFTWSCAFGQGAAAPRLDKGTLKSWLADPHLLILDVRQPQDWQSSDKIIKGAVRQDPKEVKTWAASLPKNQKIVLYCA